MALLAHAFAMLRAAVAAEWSAAVAVAWCHATIYRMCPLPVAMAWWTSMKNAMTRIATPPINATTIANAPIAATTSYNHRRHVMAAKTALPIAGFLHQAPLRAAPVVASFFANSFSQVSCLHKQAHSLMEVNLATTQRRLHAVRSAHSIFATIVIGRSSRAIQFTK